MIPPMVWVVWEDAVRKEEGPWHAHAEGEIHKYEPFIVHTVGYLLHEDERGIIITNTWTETCMAPRDQIPRGMIREMGILYIKRKSK